MTYSLSVTGYVGTNPVTTSKLVTLADTNATAGGQLAAMQNGTQFLCKGPDGSQQLYYLDAERSTPSRPVLIPVGP